MVPEERGGSALSKHLRSSPSTRAPTRHAARAGGGSEDVREAHWGAGRKVRGSRQSVTGGKGDNASSKAEGGMPFEQIRVVDPDDKKTDRTPKPLLAAHSIPLRQPAGEGASSPNAEESHAQSLDRISSTSSRMGFYESGTVSPAEIDELEEAPMADATKPANFQPGGYTPQETDAAGAGEPGCGDGPERGLGSVGPAAEVQEAPLTEQELDRLHSVTLQETPTMWLLDKPAVVAPLDSEEGTRVQERNGRYTMLLRGREASDQFSDGCAQTLNPLHKQKQMQYGLPKTAAVCCQASTWDIYDVFDQLNTLASERDEAPAGSSQAQSTDVLALAAAVSYGSVPSGGAERPINPDANRSSSMTASGTFDGRLSSMSMMGGPAEEVQPGLADAAPAMAMEPTQTGPPPIAHLSADMLPRLQLLECAVTQNLYMPQLLLYRDMKLSLAEEEPPELPAPLEAPVSGSGASWAEAAELGARQPDAAAPDAAPTPMPLEDVAALEEEDAEGGGAPAADPADLPKLKLLWIWECELTQGRNVAAMAWHPFCTDLLAVGYASYGFEEQPDGLVALWSLKNPKYPMWSFHTDSGVTALDFSTHAANMLAVGLYNGTVAMYDVRNRCPEAIIASDSGNGKHGDPVWKLQWLLRTSTSQEVLISISTDGRVTQWSTTKGLEFTDLMKLKKVARKAQAPPGAKGANVQQEAFISRLTSGMTFDFSWRDERLYIAGTEDGWIHKCSTSYSEQYLESYQGHMGPIYQVQWSPFRNNLFISCSADWTVRLWQEGRSSQLLTFRRANHDINDVQWCPANSTVFATATSGGYLELWDIAYSTLKPVAEDFLDGTSRSCLLFGKNSPVVVVGGNDGGVAVYRVLDIYRNDLAKEQQVDLLDAAMRANVIKVLPAT